MGERERQMERCKKGGRQYEEEVDDGGQKDRQQEGEKVEQGVNEVEK